MCENKESISTATNLTVLQVQREPLHLSFVWDHFHCNLNKVKDMVDAI